MERLKIIWGVLILSALLFSCKQDKKVTFCPEKDPLYLNQTVIKIKPNKLTFDLDEYISDFSGIDSIYFEGGKYSYSESDKTLKIISDFESLKPISTISIAKEENIYSLICIKNNKQKVEIRFTPTEGQNPETVKIAGSFNSWNPDNLIMKKDGEIWVAKIELDQGLYQYQVVADGIWQNNYPNADTVANGIGGYNTLLTVIDECESINFTIITDTYTDNEITIESNFTPESLFILWQNQLLPIDLNNFNDNKYTFEIPQAAKNIDRSFIRVYASYHNCISNDLLIPLNNGLVLSNPATLSRSDKHSNIMYFMLVDRFFDGDSENTKKLNDPRVHKKADYYGGDLSGINQQLDNGYFEKLGVNCLWISPIFQNPLVAYQEFPEPRRYFSGYHGYWPISSLDIDTRFGNENEFMSLVDNAHNNNMNVILDFVANHVHQDNPLYQANQDWSTDLYLADGRTNIRIWDECRLTTWFDTFLPSWDFENPEVTDTISEIAVHWLDKYNLDGFRHDATKHIPEVFWKTLTKKIRTNFPDKSIFQIGETFGSRELIDSYIGTAMLDGQFDFNLYFDARSCFADSIGDFNKLVKSLNATLNTYGHHNLMGNITGNHDLTRFITFADNSILPEEDDKEAGWNRDIQVSNPNSYKKLQNLTAFIISIPGIPCIYYGDEIGMPGAGDPDNRRPMKFNNLDKNESETLNIFQKLIQIRRNNIEFIYGSIKIIDVNNSTLIIKRQYFDNISFIIFNQSNETKNITVDKNIIGNIDSYFVNFDSEINVLTENYQITLTPYSFEIITKQN